jgi:hypothetical protein
MSSSDPSCRIDVRASLDQAAVTVLDSSFREVAAGIGGVHENLPPGIYQLRFEAGPSVERLQITLEPGATFEDTVQIEFPTSAPIEGTSTSREPHQQASHAASDALNEPGLVLVVRSLGGREPVAFGPTGLSLVDGNLRPLDALGGRWQVDAGARVATFASPLEPGPYALRVDRGALSADQALWVADGWQTIVFVPNLPSGPSPEWASVHMLRTSEAWSPWEDESTRANSALELAVWGLREGKPSLPPEHLRDLLQAKHQNPMLGIVGAHSLLLETRFDTRTFDVAMRHLERLVPLHPDVRILRRLGEEALGEAPPTSVPTDEDTFAWPPILTRGYDGLLRLDARRPGSIRDGSPAELAAAHLRRHGIWTSWEPLEPPKPAAEAGGPDAAVAVSIGRDPPTSTGDDPAVERVSTYLEEVAHLRKAPSVDAVLPSLQLDQISLATNLPTATVDRAIAQLFGFDPTG